MKSCYDHGHDPLDTGLRLSWCRRCSAKLRWCGLVSAWLTQAESEPEQPPSRWDPWSTFPVSGEGKLSSEEQDVD